MNNGSRIIISPWGGRKMKKYFALFVAVAFALSLAVMAVAAEEKKAAPAAPAKAAEPAKAAPAAPAKAAEPAKKEEAKKAKPKVVTGTIEALDAKAGTFSVKGKKETVELKAGEKVKLDGFKVGDKVTATYSDGVASKVVAAKKAAPKKEGEMKGEMKKEAAPAAPAKPAEPAKAAPAKPAEPAKK
jgi:hypothetical protein